MENIEIIEGLNLLSGFRGCGKTTKTIDIIIKSLQMNKQVNIFSLESKPEIFFYKLVSTYNNIDFPNIVKNPLKYKTEIKQFKNNKNLYMYGSYNIFELDDIQRMLLLNKNKNKSRPLVVIDDYNYIGLYSLKEQFKDIPKNEMESKIIEKFKYISRIYKYDFLLTNTTPKKNIKFDNTYEIKNHKGYFQHINNHYLYDENNKRFINITRK